MNTIKYEEQPFIIYKNRSGGIIIVCVSLMQEGQTDKFEIGIRISCFATKLKAFMSKNKNWLAICLG